MMPRSLALQRSHLGVAVEVPDNDHSVTHDGDRARGAARRTSEQAADELPSLHNILLSSVQSGLGWT